MVVGDGIVAAKEHRKRAEKAERKYGICSQCDGSGKIQIDYDDDGDPIYDTCPRCGGTGKVR